MQRLWAPWREAYITKIDKLPKGCVFCSIHKSKNDAKNYVFLRGEHTYAVLNIFPYSNGHCLILPNRHVADLSKLTADELKEMMEMLLKTKSLLEIALKPHGFNVGFNLGRLAGAGIPKHVHMHVVPRWKGDHNFMPIVSGTKVISQSLKVIYKLLTDAKQKRPRRIRRYRLADYAMKSKDSAGREYDEPQHEGRTCYQRDRDRIVHSEAFRKLEYKTQVFVIFEGDYYRTRLTHTIEVAQLARTIGRNLRLNEDLIEAIALAHDLGHPPFGHAGEDALDEIVRKGNGKGFNHNLRSFEIVAQFEKKYPNFNGLNLTREVLVGILKHETIYDTPGGAAYRKFKESPSLEAQVVDIADSLAYLNHDIDDGLTSGCINESDLTGNTLWQKAVKKIGAEAKSADPQMFKYQIVKELIDMQVKDLLSATDERLKKYAFKSSKEVKACKDEIVGFSKQMAAERDSLQQLLNEKLYHHWRVERMTTKAKRVIQDLFEVYIKNPKQLPYNIYPRQEKFSEAQKYEIIGNYIASMTDRFALDEHKRLFDPYQKV